MSAGSAKLVRQIRRDLAAGQTGRTVARAFGISEGLVSMIRSGQKWAHVTDDEPATPPMLF